MTREERVEVRRHPAARRRTRRRPAGGDGVLDVVRVRLSGPPTLSLDDVAAELAVGARMVGRGCVLVPASLELRRYAHPKTGAPWVTVSVLVDRSGNAAAVAALRADAFPGLS